MDRYHEKIHRELIGEPISPGVANAKALIFKQIALDALEMTSFPVDDPSEEINRLSLAVRKSRDQLHQIFSRLQKKERHDILDIFRAQMQMLDDETFLHELKSLVRAQKMNIEHVIASQMRVIETRFTSVPEDAIRSKFLDIQDVYHRILRNLLEIEHVRTNPLQRITSPVIFVAEKLLPSDIALLDFKKILGIIIEEGSRLSHVAVISKTLGIPAVISALGASTIIRQNDPVIVDGNTGKIIVYPTEQEALSYHEKREFYLTGKTKKGSVRGSQRCETRDGRHIRLEANIGSVKEAEMAMNYGADGIGLLRSELFYMSWAHMPSIDEEVDFYKKIIGIMKRRPITIRLLDLGADKTLPFLKAYSEMNPQLGFRGVRYLLRNRELLYRHLTSILSVTPLANIKIAIPFVATIEDVENVESIIEEICTKKHIARHIFTTGIMAETPAAALAIRNFLNHVDFVNIGTNDLVQYIFAASREDSDLEDYRQSIHPVIIRLIRNIATSARFKNKDVSVCGEIAADPIMASLLVGAGVTSFSMQPASLPLIREIITSQSFSHLQKVTHKILSLDKASEVYEIAKAELSK